MKKKKNSKLYTIVTEALDEAVKVRTDNDTILAIVDDNVTVNCVSFGNKEALEDAIVKCMQNYIDFALVICDAAFTFLDKYEHDNHAALLQHRAKGMKGN